MMAWVPIHESGVSFHLDEGGDAGVYIDGSTVTAEDAQNPNWTIVFGDDVRLRVTAVSYQSGGGCPWESPAWLDDVQNEAVDPILGWEPVHIERDGYISIGYEAARGGECPVVESFQFLIEVWDGDDPPDPPDECNFNCECDDPNPSRTLSELRVEMMRRLGFSVMTANPPPGMNELLTGFLQTAQRMLYRQYPVLRTERFFTWNMEPGVRFYDLDANRDVCTKKLDPRMLSWVGISDECDVWRPLTCGIPPECYQDANELGVPYRYEIRQCIEVWPAPDSDIYKLRIKGDFGLEPFEGDDDQCTIDDEAVFLSAMARAKAHYGHPDARNYEADAINYIRNLTAGAHLTRRYVPGERVEQPLPKPIWLPKGS